MDACATSQFEQHVRAVSGLPLGDVGMTAPAAVMVNILGDAWKWSNGECVGPPNWDALLRESRVHLHLYGKNEPRPGRKMGHFTVCDDDVASALETARRLKTALQG